MEVNFGFLVVVSFSDFKMPILENMFLNWEYTAFRIQLIQLQFSMKTKSVSIKLSEAIKYVSETNFDQTVLSTFQCQNKKNSTNKVLSKRKSPIICKVFTDKSVKHSKKNLKKPSKPLKSTKNSKKSQIPDKKKLIKKIHKSCIQVVKIQNKPKCQSKKIEKTQNQLKQTLKKKENSEKSSKKLNTVVKQIAQISTFPSINVSEQKSTKTNESKQLEVTLEESIQIKMFRFQRKQLQTKKEDLLNRVVEDWNIVSKVRSEYRELRNLGN